VKDVDHTWMFGRMNSKLWKMSRYCSVVSDDLNGKQAVMRVREKMKEKEK
jgi:hypothetical protein